MFFLAVLEWFYSSFSSLVVLSWPDTAFLRVSMSWFAFISKKIFLFQEN